MNRIFQSKNEHIRIPHYGNFARRKASWFEVKRMIFIEGVSGVGKTGTVRRLGDELRARGFAVKCHFEGDADGPLDLFPQQWRERLRADKTSAAFTRIFTELWRQFAATDADDCDFEIFDATLSHMSNDLLRDYGAEADEIAGHLEAVLQIVRRFDPHIVYLSTENVRERIAGARTSRGQPPYGEEHYAFWHRRALMDLSTLPRLSVKAQSIIIKNDGWGGVAAEIISQIAPNLPH